MKNAPSYGARSQRNIANAGVRLTASTFGKARIPEFSDDLACPLIGRLDTWHPIPLL